MLKIKLGIVLAAMATQMMATPISGVLNIFGDVQVSAPGGVGYIDFLPPVGGPTGDFTVSSLLSQDGDFEALALTPGKIKDLDQGAQPIGVPILVTEFLTFGADSDIVFDLTFINPGSFGVGDCFTIAAAGQTCTPPGSPFNLSNQTANQSVASFSVRGNVRRVSTGELSDFVMTFTTQFSDQSYQQLLSTITTGGTVEASFSGEANVIVPEPGTASLLAASGLLTAFATYMRRKLSV